MNRSCGGCAHYRAWSGRVLLIKLAAKGDVLRTTPLAKALKQKNPGCRLTWLTMPDSIPLLQGNPDVDRVLGYGPEAIIQVCSEKYDEIICLDKEPHAAGLASLLSARAKHGFGWHSGGYLVPLSKNSRHIYDLGLSDELKFEQNKKSYQQLIIEACGLEYKQQEYVLNLTQTEKDWATGYLKSLRAFNRKKYLLGINTGAGKAFPTKAWPSERIIKLYTLMKGNRNIGILLLGGDEERDLNKKILGKCPGMLSASNDLDLRQFASVIERLDVLVSSDTLAMHIGIALEKQVVALFGPTSAQEIDLYGKGVKLESKIDCAPCYRTMCKDTVCMAGISPESVMAAVKRFLKT